MSQFTKLNEEEKAHWNKAIDYALEKLYQKGWDSGNNSKKFDVVYKDGLLPPKQVVGLAFEYLDSNNIETVVTSIQGGDEHTNSFLRDFGLEILFKKKSLKYYLDQIDVWHTWRNDYKKFVPNFISEASDGKDWSEWDKNIFYEFFERSNQQCVSSLRQGYFTKEEQLNIKEHWLELAPQMQAIALKQDIASFENFELLKKNIRKYTVQDRRAATSRLIASLQPNNLCTIVNHSNLNELVSFLNKNVANANLKFSGNWYESSNAVHDFFKKESGIKDPYELVTYPWQLLEYFKDNHHQEEDNDMSDQNIQSIQEKELKLLKYKKQIILQGPPGTGKTRLAKEIAKKIILEGDFDFGDLILTEAIIREYIKPALKFNSAKDSVEYEIKELTDSGVRVIAGTGKSYVPLFKDIIKSYENMVWEKSGEITKGNDSYSAAVAKYIFFNRKKGELELNVSNQFKLIQFHPSYTYEDFVRGIVSKPNDDGDGVLYKAENKILADFAQKALVNYGDFQNLKETNVEKDVFDAFIDSVKEDLANNEQHKYPITEAVYLFTADETRFKYKGDNWVAHHKGLNMKFSELRKIIDSGAKERQDVKKMIDLEELTRQHATYFIKVVEKYRVFRNSYNLSSDLAKQVLRKNYVLIIDEINRANLSSVLGELIYALEYRGEAVESMYAVEEGDNRLVLPPNLYIVGTMNTADRSVGHIDYAIRRRFAFVDVLPKDLSQDEGLSFDTELFQQVKTLFTTDEYETRSIYLSQEFEPKDVAIGHSYFIDKAKTGGSMDIRLEYEIKPILLEYVKDGVLKVNAIPVINSLEASL